ncbi:MAG: hypothetical protein IBX56_03880 [Methylomicrobium sp.]|nr:hypothetical protein [Methylomicrobium sp.]
MIELIKAFFLALLSIWVCHISLTFLEVKESTVDALSIFIFTAGIPYIHSFLVNRKNESVSRQVIAKISEFQMPMWRVATYSVLLCTALLFLISGMVGFIEGYSGVTFEPDKANLLFQLFGYILVYPFLFWLGYWVGTRIKYDPLLIIIFSALAASCLSWVADFLVSDIKELNLHYGESVSLRLIVTNIAFTGAYLCMPMLFGGLFGKERKYSAYMSYLFKKVDKAEQDVILELAYEEATRCKKHNE